MPKRAASNAALELAVHAVGERQHARHGGLLDAIAQPAHLLHVAGGVGDGLRRLAAQAMDAAEQIDRIGGELVVAAQTLGDQQRLAGEIDRLIEAPEDVVDATDPVLDLAQRGAVVEAFGQGARLLEILEVDLVVAAVLRDARQLEDGFDLRARGVLRWRQRVREVERFLEAGPRLGRRVARGRRLARAHRVRERLGRQAGLAKVVGEQLRLARDRLGKPRLEGLADPLVELQALAAQQAVVGGVLDQRVLELVDRIRRRAAAIDQLGIDQLLESVRERRLIERRDRRQQVVAGTPGPASRRDARRP